MTSINAMTDNRYAYMTADTAVYDCSTGTVLALAPKVIVLESMRMAIAFSGRWFGLEAVVQTLDRHCPLTITPKQAGILGAIVPALRELSERSAADGLTVEHAASATLQVTVAMFDLEKQEPRVLLATAKPGSSLAEPFTLTEIPGVMAPPISPETDSCIWPEGYIKRPRLELRRLIEAQRKIPIAHMDDGCGLGGTCHFYRIGPEGVWVDDLIRFPEGVGDVLDGSLPGERIASRMDLAFAV